MLGQCAAVVPTYNLSKCLREMYQNETPEERENRLHENKLRTELLLKQWDEFMFTQPEIAKRMIC